MKEETLAHITLTHSLIAALHQSGQLPVAEFQRCMNHSEQSLKETNPGALEVFLTLRQTTDDLLRSVDKVRQKKPEATS